jgi:hypothetical protein
MSRHRFNDLSLEGSPTSGESYDHGGFDLLHEGDEVESVREIGASEEGLTRIETLSLVSQQSVLVDDVESVLSVSRIEAFMHHSLEEGGRDPQTSRSGTQHDDALAGEGESSALTRREGAR